MLGTSFQTIIQASAVSAKVVSIALIVVILTGIPMAHLITGRSRLVQLWCDTLFTVPMVLPPTSIGFGLLWLFGRRGPFGHLLDDWFGMTLTFTSAGAVLAASVVAFPLVYRSARAAFGGVSHELEEAARTLRLNEAGVFFRVSLPLARRGILVGVVLGFARAMGEFGATLMVAGNIPGKTQTLPLAIYQAVQSGNGAQSAVLCTVAAVFGVAALMAADRLERRKEALR